MAYLGNQPVVGDSTNTFKVLDDISTFTLTFDASSSDVVSVANDTLSIGQHRFITGQKVTYSDGGGTAITGLTDGSFYFIIKEDQTTIKLANTASDASNAIAIDLTGLGVGSSHTLNVKFDGTNTKFKATHTNGTKSKITRSAQLSLSVNGVIQNPAVDYSIESDSTIVFSTALLATDKVFGTFIGERARVFETENNAIDEFTGDGSSTTFNLSQIPPSSKDIIVTLDGVVQYPHSSTATRSYSAAGSQLVFTTAPDAGVVIQARHIGLAGASTPAGVTAFYGREGNVVLKSTDNISVNTVTAAGNVSIGGTLTYEDVTNVDSVGLITARSGISITGGNVTLTGGGSFIGDGSALTGIADTANINANNLNVAGITTFKGVRETTSAGSYSGTELTCDTSTGTVFTHDLQSGLVKSIKISNFPAISNSFHTVTVILTQNDAGTGHTTAALGIGTNVTLDPDGVTGFSTVAMVGSGTTVTLGTTADDINIISFGIHYNGGTNTDVSNYKTFVTKNGDFRLP